MAFSRRPWIRKPTGTIRAAFPRIRKPARTIGAAVPRIRKPPRTIRAAFPRIRKPAPTIRLRLTALYGAVFLVTGVVLLTIGYALVRHNVDAGDFRAELRKLGLTPPPGAPFFGRPLAFAPGSPEANVVAAVRAQLRSDALHRLVVEYLVALGVMTMISVAAGWLLAGRALRPLREITGTARRVSGENLGERIALSGPADELKELADTFDGMLARLDRAFAGQRHFVGNASHELRTPLTVMRTEVEVALADPHASTEELRRMGETVRDTVDRCEQLIEGLLTLARSEMAIEREEPVDVAALAGDCMTDLHVRARNAQVQLQDELEAAWTRGDPRLLERMITNLLDNAILHNVPGGYAEVASYAAGDRVVLTVRNGGHPIDPSDAQTLTEPFRRLDRAHGGFGLGLSIVRSVAQAHGGTIELMAPASGGLTVRVELPAHPAPPAAIPAPPAAISKKKRSALTKS
jgi:signal transduction histidine kinase